MKIILTLGSLILLALGIAPARAAIVETHAFNGVNLDIPDGNPSGLTNVQNFATSITQITDLEVAVRIVGTPDGTPTAFNGDIYAYLVHSTGISILLNRTGKTGASPAGYSDNGFNIVLDDQAANGDVHLYRNLTTPAAGQPLTGIWAPDARTTDPNLVLGTDPRTSFLSNFNGLDAADDWRLFVADLSTGEQQTLADWSLTITGNVPEPGTAALLAIGGLLLTRTRRRP
jgi:subtilisin-like proprotein convertase family protein